MEEKWCGYNTAMDAITELAIPSEKANRWLRAVNYDAGVEFYDDEIAIFERLLPEWHRDFLQSKHIPKYALKTSLERLARNEEEARDLWNELGLLKVGGVPAAMSILRLSILAYPLIDLAVMRRQLCQSTIIEIKNGNLKPYFYPETLEDKGLTDREKLQAFVRLPLTEQVAAKIEINEFATGLGSKETFQYQACQLWQRYRNGDLHVENPVTHGSPQAKQPQVIPQPREAKYSATESEDKRRREIYSEVVRTHAAGAKIEILIEEAATKARCSKRTMRRAVFGK